MFTETIIKKIEYLQTLAVQYNIKISTAESCTGGLLMAAITSLSGASLIAESGFITYSTESKIKLLGVPEATINKYGTVSEEVAHAMALGALKNSVANLSLAITGTAGPTGGSKDIPVGLIYLACCFNNSPPLIRKYSFTGTRTEIQMLTVKAALKFMIEVIKYPPTEG